ncbi:MAG: sulfite exporter TauE/SafE family protein, partial [Proteobacteria bacterium]|nr:sulfite exporter TauE/SafE family protein [Pseudomonadota bacterium]
MELFGYLASLLMGMSLGMIGGGGSILTIPILVYIFHINPISATGDSLFIVGITAFFAAITYIRRGLVEYRIAINFAIPSFLGVLTARRFLLARLPDPVYVLGELVLSKALLIMLAFALLMLLASYSMIKGFPIKQNRKAIAQKQSASQVLAIAMQGLFVGLIAGFVGAGGGFLIIPGLVVLVGLPMQRAIATSLLIISAQSLIGFLGDLSQHPEHDWPFLLKFVSLAIVGSMIGASLGRHIP